MSEFDNDLLLRFLCNELNEGLEGHVREALAHSAELRTRLDALQSSLALWETRVRTAGPPPEARGAALLDEPLVEDIVAGYQLLEEIGRGGQGVVYRALQIETQRQVAVKLLRLGPLADEDDRMRFDREIELASRLDHDSIVRIFDAGTTADDRRYVVMELLEGARFDQYLRQTRPTISQRIHIIRQVCHAVQSAHQIGVVHLDLKPSNVIVLAEDRVKILDFGLARHLAERSANDSGLGISAGTPHYMAPERVRQGRAPIDSRADIYAIGVMLYEALAGRVPFDHLHEPQDVLRHIETQAPPPLHNADPDLAGQRPRGWWADAQAVLSRAMAHHPDDRYAAASELAQELDRLESRAGVSARMHSRSYRIRTAARRYRWILTGLAIGMTLLVVLVAYLSFVSARQAELRRVAEQQEHDAREAEHRAQQRTAELQSLAHTFITKLDPLIRELPGALPARQVIVTESIAYLEKLGEHMTEAPPLVFGLAEAYIMLGNVQSDLNTSNAAQPRSALESYARARNLLDQHELLAPGPHDRRERLYFRALLYAGAAHLSLGEHEQYEDNTRAAHAIITQLAERRPQDTDVLHDCAVSCGMMSQLEASLGNLDDSLNYSNTARQITDRLLVDAPERPRLLRDVAVGHFELARIMMSRGEDQRALEEFQAYLQIVEPIGERSSSMVARKDVASGYEWVGRMQARLGRHQLAIESFEQALDIRRALAHEAPEHPEIHFTYASVINWIGESQLEMYDRDGARETFDDYLDIAHENLRRFPEYPRAHRMVGVALYKHVELALHLARDPTTPPGERNHAYQRARHHLEAALTQFQTMQNNGLLAASDAGVPADLQVELDELAVEIAGRSEAQPTGSP